MKNIEEVKKLIDWNKAPDWATEVRARTDTFITVLVWSDGKTFSVFSSGSKSVSGYEGKRINFNVGSFIKFENTALVEKRFKLDIGDKYLNKDNQLCKMIGKSGENIIGEYVDRPTEDLDISHVDKCKEYFNGVEFLEGKLSDWWKDGYEEFSLVDIFEFLSGDICKGKFDEVLEKVGYVKKG